MREENVLPFRDLHNVAVMPSPPSSPFLFLFFFAPFLEMFLFSPPPLRRQKKARMKNAPHIYFFLLCGGRERRGFLRSFSPQGVGNGGKGGVEKAFSFSAAQIMRGREKGPRGGAEKGWKVMCWFSRGGAFVGCLLACPGGGRVGWLGLVGR